MYSCYYCNTYQTDLEKNYERHVILTHPKRPDYPSKVDLERLGLHGKRCSGITLTLSDGQTKDLITLEQVMLPISLSIT
jgi:hypothetical protein